MKAKTLFTLAMPLLVALFWASCGGGGGGGPSGNSSVTGRVGGFAGTVRIQGTDLSTTVSDGDVFAFSGVPAGQQELQFTQGGAGGLAAGETATLFLNVPSNASIELGRVTISGNSAVPSQIRVEIFEDNRNSNSDDNGNDDNGNDDNANSGNANSGNANFGNANDDDDDDDSNANS